MLIGNYVVEGEVIHMKKPFLAFQKHEGASDMELQAIVKKKILFKTRPRPKAAIVTKLVR
jgi:hypothetical protein